DVFALGCVPFVCITGRRAFEADHVMALLAKILLDDVPRVRDLLPDVPPALDAIVCRMVAKDPAERPSDASELAALFAELDARSSVISEPVPSLTRREQRTLGVILVSPRAPKPETLDP